MIPARVDNKIDRLMRGAHKILKEWIDLVKFNNQKQLLKIPVIVNNK